jgi:hypothetical protein
VTNPLLEEALSLWIAGRESRGEPYTGPLLIEKAKRFAKELNISSTDLSFSAGWLSGFKKRHGLKQHRRHGESGSTDPKLASEEHIWLHPILKKYPSADIFNVDETGFFYQPLLAWTLSKDNMPGTKISKTRLTILVGTNTTGTEKLKLMFIGKAKKPRCFKKRTSAALGFDYHNNAKAWMTGVIFSQYIAELDKKMVRQNRKILLLIDNFSGHQWNEKTTKNIQIEFFTANLTPFVQPMDAGIIRTLKAVYQRLKLERSLDRERDGEANIFKIDQLEAMHLMEQAWEEVSTETVANCWRHTGILPKSPE